MLVAVPLADLRYPMRWLTGTLLFVTLSVAWNLMGGFGGYLSFGNVAFFGFGAYATAVTMTRWQQPFGVALLVGGVCALVFGVLFTLPMLRLRGHYFAIGTMAIAEGTRELFNTLTGITGGGMGLSVPIATGDVGAVARFFYWSMAALALASVLASVVVVRGRLGHALIAVREDEEAAGVIGINTTLVKTTVFGLAALMTGLAGGLYAYWITILEPNAIFSVQFSVSMVLMTVLGGAGTILGPVLGAFLFDLLSETVWQHFLLVQDGLLGLLMILVVLLMPRGLMEFIERGRTAFSLSALRDNLRRYSV